jgi:hypothetical protein
MDDLPLAEDVAWDRFVRRVDAFRPLCDAIIADSPDKHTAIFSRLVPTISRLDGEFGGSLVLLMQYFNNINKLADDMQNHLTRLLSTGLMCRIKNGFDFNIT